jgi:hypothetical protein
MRIAQISPLTEAVPPKLYGGTEHVISWLTKNSSRLGTTSRCLRAAIHEHRRSLGQLATRVASRRVDSRSENPFGRGKPNPT